jgi:AGZA family xanthine/uracil permease-like MFS transporter
VLSDKSMQRTTHREILAGISTFLTIAYLFVLYPQLLAIGGIDLGAAFTATILITAIATFCLGHFANFPLAIGPGLMGAIGLVYFVILRENLNWQTALGVVFWSGLVMCLLGLFKTRHNLATHLPEPLKIGTIGGMGLLLIAIGLKELNILSFDPNHFWKFEGIGSDSHIIAFLSLVLLLLIRRRVIGSYIITIGFGWVMAYMWNLLPVQEEITALPPSIFPTLFELDLVSSLKSTAWPSIAALFLLNLFESSVSLRTLTKKAHLPEGKGKMLPIDPAATTDGAGTVVGAFLGTGTLSFLTESAVGIRMGGRLGWTAMTTAICSLIALAFFPFISSIPLFVTMPVLMVVGYDFLAGVMHLRWGNFTETLPALLMLLAFPLTLDLFFSFMVGFVSYVLLKILAGQARQLHPFCWLCAIALAAFSFYLI